MDNPIKIIFFIFGTICILDTIFVISFSSLNFGNLFPAALGTLLILYSIFRTKILYITQTGMGRYIKIIFILSLIIFIATFILSVIVISNHASKEPPQDADAVIVLGAGLNGENVSKTLAMRLDEAIEYHNKNTKSIIIVTGGQGPGELTTEASAMQKYLINKGIDPKKILLENTSTSTKENFSNAKTILDEYFSSDYTVVYVTSDFHVYRAGMIANDCGFSASGLASSSYKHLLPNFYIREYFSIIKYFIT